MFRNIFIISVRNLLRQKLFSLVAIVGLALGIAATLLILLNIQDELGYDQHWNDADQIVRLERASKDSTWNITWVGENLTPAIVPYLRADVPEIEAITRVYYVNEADVREGDRAFIEDGFIITEPEVFDALGVELLTGNRETALEGTHNTVISESLSKRYFGDEEPLGRELIIMDEAFVVTGVFKDIPKKSHLYFTIMISDRILPQWFGNYYYTHYNGDKFTDNITKVYAKLVPGTDIDHFNTVTIPEFIKRTIPPDLSQRDPDNFGAERFTIHAQPITKMHLRERRPGQKEQTALDQMRLLIILAGFVLLIACINYMNLTTARATRRAQEVGFRKVVGANRGALITQFLGESFVITFIAVVLAFVMVTLALPAFNAFIQRDLTITLAANPLIYIAAGVLLLIVSFIAGYYPAVYLSAFEPGRILRGELTRGKKGAALRRSLVVTQFALAAALSLGVIVTLAQYRHISKMNLGFNDDQILIVPIKDIIRTNWETYKQRTEAHPGIEHVSGSKYIPSGSLGDCPPVNVITTDGTIFETPFRVAAQRVELDFNRVFDFNIVAGRDFSPDFPTDLTEGCIVNESFAKGIGYDDPEKMIGAVVDEMGRKRTVVGVVQDFNFESLHNRIFPMNMYPSYARRYVLMKIDPSYAPEAIDYAAKVWDEVSQGLPFQWEFLDARFDALYRREQQISTLIGFFSGFAIFIASLGLLGLAAYATDMRLREISIRKVLGATEISIIKKFSWEFAVLVTVGCVIGIPPTWYMLRGWLQDYAYHISISWVLAPVILVLALIVAFTAVIPVVWRAAQSNPAEVLRSK